MNGEDPTRRMTILMLPDDLVLNCLARVSRSYYPTLSSVSKRFRSLVASTELYQTRTILGRTESCLYVCLWLCPDSNPLRWFTLSRSSKKMILVPISAHNFPSGAGSEVAVVGPHIYGLGGLGYYASSRVMVMDCRSHKWRDAPSMQVARVSQSACVLDGKIYVAGGCLNLDSTNWMEVFDTKTQTWEFLQIPSEKICKGSMYESVRFEGTIYVRSKVTDVTYKLNKGRWREADIALSRGWDRSSSHCVIDNVFYRYDTYKTIDWYDSNLRFWKRLKGLEIFISTTRLSTSVHVKLTDYGGKMVVLWEEYKNHHHTEKLIWCAEIAIEKRQNGEIWGMLEWFDVVSTTNGTSSLAHALTTTI